MSLSRKRACLAGMAAAGATGSCSAFSAMPLTNNVGRNGVVRSRVTRIGSTVDVPQRKTRSGVAANTAWSKTNEVCLVVVGVSCLWCAPPCTRLVELVV